MESQLVAEETVDEGAVTVWEAKTTQGGVGKEKELVWELRR